MSEIYRDWHKVYEVTRGQWVARAVWASIVGGVIGFMLARLLYP